MSYPVQITFEGRIVRQESAAASPRVWRRGEWVDLKRCHTRQQRLIPVALRKAAGRGRQEHLLDPVDVSPNVLRMPMAEPAPEEQP